MFEDFIFFTLLQFQRNSVAFLHLYNVILTHNDWECVEIIGFFSCFFNVFYVLFFCCWIFKKPFTLVQKIRRTISNILILKFINSNENGNILRSLIIWEKFEKVLNISKNNYGKKEGILPLCFKISSPYQLKGSRKNLMCIQIIPALCEIFRKQCDVTWPEPITERRRQRLIMHACIFG